MARDLGLRPNTKGGVVTDIDPASPAADAGLESGDVIEEINRQPVTSVQEYERLIRSAGKQELVLSVNRHGNTAYIAVEPE